MEYNLADLFEAIVDVVPEREALICGERRLTYAETDARANRLAHHLAAHGVGPGDHVALLLYNGTEYLEGMLAAFKLRAVPINVNYRYIEEELRYLLDDSDAKAIVFHREFAPRLAAIDDALPTAHDPPRRRRRVGSDPRRAPRDRLRSRAGGVIARARLPAADRRRPLHPLHGRHDREPEGRDVARRGHLLRRSRRREPRRRARSPARNRSSTRSTSGAARCRRAR